jgi:peptidoglycan/LPS O-acetylase OafA/YrhL
MEDTGRLSALDGLRGTAVLLVVSSHLGLQGLQRAGGAGVTVFFVLSGYLITGILLKRPTLKSFYLRRALRLLPALLLMLVVLSIPAALAGSTTYFAAAALTLSYASNWAQVAGINMGVLTPMWTLAVEEQFYLLWPFVVWWVPRRRLVPVLLTVVLASLAIRLSVAPPHATRGTDTTAYALAAGAILASWRPSRLPRLAHPIGWLLIAAAAFYPWVGTTLSPVTAAIGALIVIATVAQTEARVLGATPLAYVGRISYGWYLWHLPLIGLATPANDPDTTRATVAAVAAMAAAALSYGLVEMPVRRWTARRHGTTQPEETVRSRPQPASANRAS